MVRNGLAVTEIASSCLHPQGASGPRTFELKPQCRTSITTITNPVKSNSVCPDGNQTGGGELFNYPTLGFETDLVTKLISVPTLPQVAPLVIPLNPDCTVVEGFLNASSGSPAGSQYWVRVSGLGAGGRITESAAVELDEEARQVLDGMEAAVNSRLKECAGIDDFFMELRNLLSRSPPDSAQRSHRGPEFFRMMFQDIVSLRENQLAQPGCFTLSDDLSVVMLRYNDTDGRQHALSLTLPPAFPTASPIVTSIDLPQPFKLKWIPSMSCLTDAYTQFRRTVDSFKRLWQELDDLDRHAWVIEPSAPTRSCIFRRIVLEKHVSVSVKLDPKAPGALPDLAFMGSDKGMEPLLARVQANRWKWNPECSVLTNLAEILEMQIPKQGSINGTDAASMGIECGICYNFRRPRGADDHTAAPRMDVNINEGDVPDICCDNAFCGKPFHRQCLLEWLASDPSTRTSFGTMFGACPYCSAPVAVKS